MSLGKFSLREMQARPLRLLFTFSSIALGVGGVVAVLLATSTTRQAQRDMLKAVSGKADLELVTSSEGAGFPDSWLKEVRATAGVETAVPSINRTASIFSDAQGEKTTRTQVLGIDPRIDQLVRDYDIVQGRLPTSLDEILLDSSFAKSLNVELDSTVKLLSRGSRGLQVFHVVGFVRPNGSEAVALSSAVYLVLPTAQAAFRARGQLDQIHLTIASGAEVNEVQRVLKSKFPTGVVIRQPRTSSAMARETLFATENGLFLSIAFALLITSFIIYNTFQMTVGERRKQIGILRAIGATRRQVAWMIVRESLWISVIGAIAGSFLGVFLAGYLNQATETVLQVKLPRVDLSVLPFVVAAIAGIGVSLLGAILPAYRASTVHPVEAMRAIEIRHNAQVIRITMLVGCLVFPLGILLLLLSLTGKLPLGSDAVAIIFMLLGCVLFIPLVLQSCSGILVRVLSHWLGIEAKLAHKQLMRHIGRTTLTTGVLFIAISTSTGLAGNIMDNVANIRNWYKRAIIGDFFVRASLPDLASGTAADMQPEIGQYLKEIQGIDSIDPMRFVSAHSGEDSIVIIVRSFVGATNFFDIVEGSNQDALKGLRNHQAVIGSVLATRRGLKVGDKLPIETAEGTALIVVAATTNDYIGGGLSVYLDREYAMELLGIDGVDAYVIEAAEGQGSAVETRLTEFCQEHGLIMQSYAELTASIDGMVNGVIASLWMLLAFGGFIAAMGLINTLSMNILEQTREIGMLRVVAMTRAQVRRMIFSQALLLGVIGLLPGLLAGVFVEYAIGLSSFAVLGHSIAFQFRPGLFFGCLAASICIVVLSSLIPAERAARLKLSAALRYE
jgi:putative ABC transport system permease protein